MIPALLLVLSVAAYRVMTGLLIHSGAATWLSNFAPLAAIALCCAAYLPRRYKFTLPLATLFVSDLILNAGYHVSLFEPQMIARYGALALVGVIGYALKNRASLKTMLPASVLGSVVFYTVTNAFSWLTDPGYAKNLGGLVQALTVGLPAYSATPSWMFFRNSLLSDLVFTAAFVLSMRARLPHARERLAPARVA
jgi:hypothetical protein